MTSAIFDPVEEEINAIRLQIYEEIKDMTPEEEARYFISRTDPVIRQFNMKMSTLKPVRPIRREEREISTYSEDVYRQ
ncbi:MAG: hypothetical protein IJR35_06465 [Synergistaceae bacterium]|nr:hypothetical protein [Synergistaceae bacterium]MBQ9595490.1 hypothetical protein [Synergistaceae bacterium]